MTRLNILDYLLIDEGKTARDAIHDTTELAKLADDLGYHRFWVPEQHHALSIASSSPELLMMHLAGQTKKIRIGSGGIMLPHYSPFKVSEIFRTLEAIHPNRIDLGIGNSTGGRLVNHALNEEKEERLTYEQQVRDIQKYLSDDTKSSHRFQKLIATPVTATHPEMWMLGAGGSSTKIAAEFGTSYTYAHFIKPFDVGIEIINTYRKQFKPSLFQDKPYVAIAVFVVVGKTTDEAEQLAKSFDLWMASLETAKNPPYFPNVVTASRKQFSPFEKQKINNIRKRAIIGDSHYVKEELQKLIAKYNCDEVIIIPNIPGIENRKTAIELLAKEFQLT
ncbi:LLM class flavin-dependent oxidoreductase [Oceanobacillus sp. 1P07AA]|uniref:LLM class flavin-dependent oxidoreductase n=1 Tax=Oceanobacillus sp. 1P07AA TaxID=3132293 RepID=UPI0039A4468B